MATQSYTAFRNSQSKAGKSEERAPREFKVGYFTALADDGDAVAVRFDYGTQDEFQDVTVHQISLNERFRSVSCLKPHGYDSDDLCPLCKAGNKAKHKTYLKMLVYSKSEDGSVTYKAVAWERPSMIIQDIINAIQEGVEDDKYAANTPIRDMMFKIKRNGKKGDKGTTYRITALNPTVYPASTFKPDFSAFEDFDITHHSYMVKTAEEMQHFLKKGEFPAPKRAETPKETKSTTTPAEVEEAAPVEDEDLFANPAPAVQPAPAPVKEEPKPAPAPARTNTGSTNPAESGARPKRTYTF